ncbi:MAG TPA: ABC transporter ATP-binding protein [Thermoplasmata archaeon]|jgi:multiple sugar transport system ATP-binding protein|nr:ABC transporter ATP-binding protein [Thermoplasmata archaeon]
MTGIRLENVTKRFKTTLAVDDVTFSIRDGEFVVILGASGSGKSTILRIIAGLEVQTSGHVYIGDMQVDDYEPRDRNIAMVFQSYALYPHLRVYDNIAFGLRVRRVPREDDPDRFRRRTRQEIDDRVRHAADLLGIGDTLRKKPSELSGGQRQRVALARAIVRDPEAFLLDEPLSNLDAKIRSSARIELKRIHEQLKQTFVFVTHDQSEAMTLADRLVIVDHGRLLQFDTPENVLRSPANQFVASFVGSPEMVFLQGALTSVGGAYAFELDPVRIPVRGASSPGPTTIGFRPWDLAVDRAVGPGALSAVVRGVERLGSSDQLFLELNRASDHGVAPPSGVSLRAMAPAYEFQIGDTVGVTIRADRALFFGADGARLDALEGGTA